MNKFLITLSFIFLIISMSLFGYKIVSAKQSVTQINDMIEEQALKDKYLTPYGYTIDNPNIVLNPYDNSPLSAIILFETKEEVEITVTVNGITEEDDIKQTYKLEKVHIIPIFGLYPNKENKIEISTPTITKNFTIKTNPLPDDFLMEEDIQINEEKDLTIYKSNKYLYGVDKNKEIRWFYLNQNETSPYVLENNNLLIPIATNPNTNKLDSLIEIDLMGKIYKQYYFYNEISDNVLEKKNSIFILGSDLIEIDKQTGDILNTYKLDNIYNRVSQYDDSNIILSGENNSVKINLENKKKISIDNYQNDTQLIALNLYTENSYYQKKSGIRLQNKTETKQSNKRILLIGYISPDKKYQDYNIEFQESANSLQISLDNNNDDEVYVILDKFLDKRVYELEGNSITINKTNLSGKYSIYIKINKTIYKTNKYISI